MTYAIDFLRGDMQGLSMRLLAGKISEGDRAILTDLVDFFQEHHTGGNFPCQYEGCKDDSEVFIALNDDDGVNVCTHHSWIINHDDHKDPRFAATPEEALHAKNICLYDTCEGNMTDYGMVLGFYTGNAFSHWVATLDFPRWCDIYQDGNNFFGENMDRFGRVRFWKLIPDSHTEWELMRWAHQADLLPMGQTDRGDFDNDGFNRHPLDTPITGKD